MKKLLSMIITIILASSLFGCTGSMEQQDVGDDALTEESTESTEIASESEFGPGEIPFDYPVVETTAKEGEYVLAPAEDFLTDLYGEEGTDSTVIFYSAKMITPGAEESVVEDAMGDQYSVANSLIVPLGAGETAEVGDVLLTWWQSGSGLERAIVTGGGAEPTVRYLDDFMTEEDTLEANSFYALSGGLEPGIAAAVPGTWGQEMVTVINVAGDKVLASVFAGRLDVFSKSDLTLIPLTLDVSVGDTVYAPVVGAYKEVTVKEVNADIGQITAEYDWAGEMEEEVFVFSEISNNIPME